MVGSDSSNASPGGGTPASTALGTGASSERRTPRLGYWLAAIGLAVAFLVANVNKSGIWDPYELDRADFARRIAIALFGPGKLAIDPGPNVMPTLGDLGMGELPFTSMAVGFRVLGLHDYSGRLPLALWAVAGALVLFVFLERLVSPRAGLYGVIVLCTMPLYFVHARTMLGDIVTMAAFAACFCGLCAAMLDNRAPPGWRRTLGIGVWLLLGLGGALAGFMSRGIIIGVAAPALGVGLGWLCLWAAGAAPEEARDRWQLHLVGAAALVLGLAALGAGVRVLLGPVGPTGMVRRMLGMALLESPPVEATFDLTVRDLGHALFPWSGFLPLAFGRLFRVTSGIEPAARSRELGLRVALLAGSAAAYAAFALLAPRAGGLPFAGPVLLAAIAAVVILDFERGAAPSIVLGTATVVLTLVLWRDIAETPLRALSVFGVAERTFPKDFESRGGHMMLAAAALFAAMCFFSWLGHDWARRGTRLADWALRRIRAYRRYASELAKLWNGNLLFGLMVVEAALVGLGTMLLVGRRLGWASVTRLPHNFSLVGLNAWWVLPLLPVVLLVAFDLVRGLFASALAWVGLPRAAGTALGALLAGGLLCFGYYPALATQLSPREVFVRYGSLHGAGEPLGVLGLGARSARYYAGGEQVEALTSARAAHRWLTAPAEGGKPSRRWLVLRSKDLPELNSLFRESSHQNLPVIDAQSGSILLASNQLGDAHNQSWLESLVLSQVPFIQHPVAATFEGELQALGWDVVDASGKLVDYVVPQRSYRLRLYYRVLARMARNYKSFVHVDGYQRRHNGDHDVMRGLYPLNLWQPDDIVVDELDLELEPNFTPGSYTVYYGFFQGETRYRVTEGSSQDNRVIGGTLTVR